MTKYELVEKAIENGYKADIVDNIPYIYGKYKEVDRFVKSIRYNGSYGIKSEVNNE